MIRLIFSLIKAKGSFSSYDFDRYYDIDLLYYFKTKYFSDLNKRPIEEIYQIGFELGCKRFYPQLLLAQSFQYGNYYEFIHGYLEYECGLSQKRLSELSIYYEARKISKDIVIKDSGKDFIGNVLTRSMSDKDNTTLN